MRLSKKKRAFCRAFLRTMDARSAAEEAGVSDGYAMLERAEVRAELERMRETTQRELRREDVLRALARLAFSTAEGVGETLFAAAEERGGIPDLSAVAEVKRNSAGSVEIKFVDRIKALSTLYELLGSSESEGAEEFFRALQEAGE